MLNLAAYIYIYIYLYIYLFTARLSRVLSHTNATKSKKCDNL